MPDYSYVARAKDGTIQKDVINAYNERAVFEALRGQGLLPTSIKEVRKTFDLQAILSSFSKIKLIDKITFIKNMGVMIKAGIPVSKSLKILSQQTSNKKFAVILTDVHRAVESGSSLADALAKYPNVFPKIFISMVHVGEVSGNLEQNLRYLAEQMQRDYDLITKTRGAMTYPIIVVVALVLVGFVMFTFVLPKLTETFKEFDVELPVMTKIVIALVDLFANYGLILFPLLVVAAVAFLFWRKTDSGRVVVHRLVLFIPIFGPIVKKVNLARFVGVFSSLMKSGMPIVEALAVSSEVVGNIYYKQTIADAGQKVKVGSPLASGFKRRPDLFSPLVVQMMEVGEESGTTDTVLTEVGLFYEAEVDQTMKNLSAILEPVMMIVIGAMVGFMAVALISPIYSITQSV